MYYLGLLLAIWLLATSCGSTHAANDPMIEFTRVPPAGDGSPDKLETIEGRVRGARADERIVLFARSGTWWVQPLATQPFTVIQPNGLWQNTTHPGSAYAALLVKSDYHTPLVVDTLPERGGPVLAVSTVDGAAPVTPLKTLQFGGYPWEMRETSSDAGGSKNLYDPDNAWTDSRGFLHVRILKRDRGWSSAEVKLGRSLGYGSYMFVVEDVSHLEPAVVFAMFTWDDAAPREMDIEISRWGELADKNGQFVIQPYLVPANTVRFNAPAGPLTYWMDWQPDRVTFRTKKGADTVAEHVFTSGIPSPGSERIHMNMYVYGNKKNPLQHGAEVIVEKFEYLP
jgi:hypothetical protein